MLTSAQLGHFAAHAVTMSEGELHLLDTALQTADWALFNLGLIVEAAGPRLAEEAASAGAAHAEAFTEARLREYEAGVPRALDLVRSTRDREAARRACAPGGRGEGALIHSPGLASARLAPRGR